MTKDLTSGKMCIRDSIADVSHYVRPDTALDKEAYERATSIYYADKVIPMPVSYTHLDVYKRQLKRSCC